MQVGVPRDQALRNLVDRTNVADLRHFVFALLQAQKHGVSVSQVLRVQTAELRVKRRQRAEEKAMKIPVKILFPLVTCIFPVIFIVLLGPAAIQIMRNLVRGALNMTTLTTTLDLPLNGTSGVAQGTSSRCSTTSTATGAWGPPSGPGSPPGSIRWTPSSTAGSGEAISP